jgi:hypothetical protein
MTDGPVPTTINGCHLPAGAAPPTLDDPTAGGVLCGCRRRPKQIEQDREAGIEHPWPFCQRRAGTGTDHPGIGQCSQHGGNSPSGRKSAHLRYAELQGAVVHHFYRVMVDPKAKTVDRLRAAENLADRGGSPRRTEVDVETARQTLYERLLALQSSEQASS